MPGGDDLTPALDSSGDTTLAVVTPPVVAALIPEAEDEGGAGAAFDHEGYVWGAIKITSALGLVALVYGIAQLIKHPGPITWVELAAFGSYLAGTFGVAVTLASVALFYDSLRRQGAQLELQRTELGLQRQELAVTRSEIKRQADEAKRAADEQARLNERNERIDFVTTLFSLLDAVRNAREGITYRAANSVQSPTTGHSAVPRVMKRIRERALDYYVDVLDHPDTDKDRFSVKQSDLLREMQTSREYDLSDFFEGNTRKQRIDTQFLSSYLIKAYRYTMLEDSKGVRPFIATVAQLLIHLERAPEDRKKEYGDLVAEQFSDDERALIAVASLFDHFHSGLRERLERTRFMHGIDDRADPVFTVIKRVFKANAFDSRY